ncbi:MAG: uroporphyrinogen decarboxylase [Bacteroidota bacterium]
MKIKNDLLLRTLHGESVERPPVWLMRQAGRILPQYRAIRNSLSGFIELVTTPALAAEVTVQPVDELDVDAAIIFSDILVIPEAMGVAYEMVEKKGPSFPNPITEEIQIDQLVSGEDAAGKLEYVYEAIRQTKKELDGRVPLIGFSGAPWTLLAYMIEGGGSKTFSKARRFLYTHPKAAHKLLDKTSDSIIAYLKGKVSAGADVIQLFDSWAGVLSPALYKKFSLPYISKICNALTDVPVIVFAKDAWFALEEIGQLNCQAVGLDWTVPPALGRKWVSSEKILQGNLDPTLLYSTQQQIEGATSEMIQAFGSKHIVNLGHGVYPDTPLENVKHFVNFVKHFSYK